MAASNVLERRRLRRVGSARMDELVDRWLDNGRAFTRAAGIIARLRQIARLR